MGVGVKVGLRVPVTLGGLGYRLVQSEGDRQGEGQGEGEGQGQVQGSGLR